MALNSINVNNENILNISDEITKSDNIIRSKSILSKNLDSENICSFNLLKPQLVTPHTYINTVDDYGRTGDDVNFWTYPYYIRVYEGETYFASKVYYGSATFPAFLIYNKNLELVRYSIYDLITINSGEYCVRMNFGALTDDDLNNLFFGKLVYDNHILMNKYLYNNEFHNLPYYINQIKNLYLRAGRKILNNFDIFVGSEQTQTTRILSNTLAIAPTDGIIKHVTLYSSYENSVNTIRFRTGRFDTTWGYVDLDNDVYEVAYKDDFQQSVIKEVECNIPIKKGYNLFVDVEGSIRLFVYGYNDHTTATIPPEYPTVIIYYKDSGYVETSYWISFELFFDMMPMSIGDSYATKDDIEAVYETIDNINVKSASNSLIYDSSGEAYKITIKNNQLVPQNIVPKNILFCGHSFVMGWGYGMSASTPDTDFVGRIIDSLENKWGSNNVTFNRLGMGDWERNISLSKLRELLNDTVITDDVETIVFMCGANMASEIQNSYQNSYDAFYMLYDYMRKTYPDKTVYACSGGYTVSNSVQNQAIRNAATYFGYTYINTFFDDSDGFERYGDVLSNLVVNSAGRVNHPNDIWHLYMARQILKEINMQPIVSEKSISVINNNSADIEYFNRWVPEGLTSIVFFDTDSHTVTAKDSNNNNIEVLYRDLSSITWETVPSKIPKQTYYFMMPNSNVTVTVD